MSLITFKVLGKVYLSSHWFSYVFHSAKILKNSGHYWNATVIIYTGADPRIKGDSNYMSSFKCIDLCHFNYCYTGNCLPGYRIERSGCQICPIGSYQSLQWQDECIPCPLHKSTVFAGSTDYNDCICK